MPDASRGFPSSDDPTHALDQCEPCRWMRSRYPQHTFVHDAGREIEPVDLERLAESEQTVRPLKERCIFMPPLGGGYVCWLCHREYLEHDPATRDDNYGGRTEHIDGQETR